MNTAAPSAAAPVLASRDTATGSASPHRSDLRFGLAVATIAAIAYAAFAWQHTPWRDELQAWAIVRDSSDLGALFGQLHYEGHPALWYLVLWLPSRLTRSYDIVQVIHWIVITAAAFLFAWRAPFGRITRVLVLCSYFPLYEYGMVARGYALAWLLTILVLAFVRTNHGLLVAGIGCALLANTTILAIPLAAGLMIGIIVDRSVRSPESTAWQRVLAGALTALGIGAALVTAWPASDANHVEPIYRYESERFSLVGSTVVRALIPFPARLHHFWDRHFTGSQGFLVVIVSVVLAATIAWVVCRRPAALATWLVPVVVVPFVIYTRDLRPSMRFCGVLFIAAVAALWLARIARPSDRASEIAATAIGAVGTLASAILLPFVLTTPFTAAAATATWVQSNAPANATIVCDTAYRCSSVGIRLDRPTRAADDPGPFTFAVFRENPVTGVDPTTYAVEVATVTRRPVVLLTADRPAVPPAEVRAHFTRSIVGDETYWVAIISPAN